VNLTEIIGVHYMEFGILLLDDFNGHRMDTIEREYRAHAQSIVVEVLRLWLRGSGRQPVSWATFVDVLHNIELNALAHDIQQVKGLGMQGNAVCSCQP
jgi:hypothetical protein